MEQVEYELDSETEAAARRWILVVDIAPMAPGDTEPGALALRCAECQSCLISRGYTFAGGDVLPLVRTHIIRAHGYPANPVKLP